MTAVDVTIIDKVSSAGARQELSTILSDVLVSRDPIRQSGELRHWRFIVRAACSTPLPEGKPDRSVSDLDYTAWLAHLAGSRQWTPDRHRGLNS